MPTLMLIVVLSLIAAPDGPKQSDTRVLLRIEVKDDMGAVIPNSHVFIRWDPSGSKVGVASNVGIEQDSALKTNDAGVAAALLPPGFYDVFVSSMGFTPQAKKVRLKNNAQHVDFKVRVDPLVAKELPGVTVEQPAK